MKITIAHTHEGFTRTITVQVVADTGKKLSRVKTTYDRFVEDDDTLNPPVSMYDTEVKKTEGISPGQKHTVLVEACHTDNSTDAAQKSWID